MKVESGSIPTSDEKLMSALAHFFGLFVALVVWALQKEKSRFVRFQALQALAFDGVVALFSMAVSLCLCALMFAGIFISAFSAVNSPGLSQNAGNMILLSSMLPALLFACMLPYSFVLLAIRSIAALSVLSGRDFHYPALGKRVESFLEN